MGSRTRSVLLAAVVLLALTATVAGAQVTGEILIDQNRQAGTHRDSGALLLYTPDPVQPGSSVSHWDTERHAEPADGAGDQPRSPLPRPRRHARPDERHRLAADRRAERARPGRVQHLRPRPSGHRLHRSASLRRRSRQRGDHPGRGPGQPDRGGPRRLGHRALERRADRRAGDLAAAALRAGPGAVLAAAGPLFVFADDQGASRSTTPGTRSRSPRRWSGRHLRCAGGQRRRHHRVHQLRPRRRVPGGRDRQLLRPRRQLAVEPDRPRAGGAPRARPRPRLHQLHRRRDRRGVPGPAGIYDRFLFDEDAGGPGRRSPTASGSSPRSTSAT